MSTTDRRHLSKAPFKQAASNRFLPLNIEKTKQNKKKTTAMNWTRLLSHVHNGAAHTCPRFLFLSVCVCVCV